MLLSKRTARMRVQTTPYASEMAPEAAKAHRAARPNALGVTGRTAGTEGDADDSARTGSDLSRTSAPRPARALALAAAKIVSARPSRPIRTKPESRQPTIAPVVFRAYSAPMVQASPRVGSCSLRRPRAPRTPSGNIAPTNAVRTT